MKSSKRQPGFIMRKREWAINLRNMIFFLSRYDQLSCMNFRYARNAMRFRVFPSLRYLERAVHADVTRTRSFRD